MTFNFLKFLKLCRYIHGPVFDNKDFIIPFNHKIECKGVSDNIRHSVRKLHSDVHGPCLTIGHS